MSVRFMSGLIQGFNKSQDRYTAIRAARDKKRQDDKELGLRREEMELKLKILRNKEGDNSLVNILEEQLKNQFDLEDAQSVVADDQIDNALKVEEERMGTFKRTGAKLAATMMKQQPLDWSYNTGSQSFNIRPSNPGAEKTTEIEKVMGIIDSKVDAEGDDISKEDAMRMASHKLGYGWEKKHPEVLGLIKQRYDPPDDILGVAKKSSESVQPDTFGFTVGEERDIPNKGRYRYLGNNKWKKAGTE